MIDPRMLTDPVDPPYARKNAVAVLAAEVWDHLWPLSGRGFRKQAVLQAIGLAGVVAATLMWVFAARGQLEAGVVIGSWIAWSVLEVGIRLRTKPYVKEGPWWGRAYRKASLMDMLCYVSFKNLLLGAAIFIALKSAGALVV